MELAFEYLPYFRDYLLTQGQKMFGRSWPNPDEEFARFFYDGVFFIVRGFGSGDTPNLLKVHSADRNKLDQLEKSWYAYFMVIKGGSMEELLNSLDKAKEEQE